MQYTKPLNETDPNASYVNADPANGQEGSVIPAGALENPQREIVNAITSLGITPVAAVNQLATALLEVATISDYCSETPASAANAYVLATTGTVTYSALKNGQKIRFTVTHPNTGSSTINAYGTGAKAVKKFAGSANLSSGDLLTGAVVEFSWNSTGNYWEFISTSYETTGVQNYDVFCQSNPFLEVNGKRNLTIKSGTIIRLEVDGVSRWRQQTSDEIINCESIMDTGTSFINGKDYHLFLIPSGTNGTAFIISQNSTYPGGYTAANSRKIGGFHTECVNVGTISGHPLSGYLAGDILPQSVWCLNHRPISEPEGMVYDSATDVWVDIYNQSGIGSNTKSVYGGTRSNTRIHDDFEEDQLAVKKQLLDHVEFLSAMDGSNQRTVVYGSAQPNPDTTGGHKDTASRRMVSYIGCEEGCGLQWQHLRGTYAVGSANWVSIPGDKGDTYGTMYVARAGAAWDGSSHCGSRSRNGNSSVSGTIVAHGGRGRSLPKHMPN